MSELTMETLREGMKSLEQAESKAEETEKYHRELPGGFEKDGLVWIKDKSGFYPGAWVTKATYANYQKMVEPSPRSEERP